MASCWKVSWNVDPLPFSVPLRLEEPPDEALLDAEPPDEELLPDEEHAPRVSASATTETPAAVTCCLYRSCISSTPFPAAMSAASDGRSACKTVVCEYSLSGSALPAGKQKVDRRGLGS
jgi:hypothetical protein